MENMVTSYIIIITQSQELSYHRSFYTNFRHAQITGPLQWIRLLHEVAAAIFDILGSWWGPPGIAMDFMGLKQLNQERW